MEHNSQFAAEDVLKQKTKYILSEIECLMKKNGVEACLKDKNDRRNKPPGRSQFQSLMNAVGEAACVEELVLFLSYQESKTDGWGKKCKDGSTIAKKVVDSFIKTTDAVYSCMEEACGAENIRDNENVLRLKIVEKYMGYLYWGASAVIS